MSQVIVYTNASGYVAVCTPSPGMSIEVVKAKDTPAGSIIIDSSTLPSGDDAKFSDAWEIAGSTIVVNMTNAKSYQLTAINKMARFEQGIRDTNNQVDIPNNLSNEDWLSALSSARAMVNGATSCSELVAAIDIVKAAILANG
jgi:hypothetical protein